MQNAVVSHEDWLAARRDLLQKEKELTHLRDGVASERLALPWERIEKDYVFEDPFLWFDKAAKRWRCLVLRIAVEQAQLVVM